MGWTEQELHEEGSRYILDLCEDKKCHTSAGAKAVFFEFNGYESDGGKEITADQIDRAIKAADEHNRNHRVRVIIGK